MTISRSISVRFIWIGLIAMAAALMIASRPAAACSCAPMGGPQSSLEASDRVFLGKVIAARPGRSNGLLINFTFLVNTTWKGEVLSNITVASGNHPAACGYPFVEGESYLIYASSPGFVGLCDRIRILEEATHDLQVLGAGMDVPPLVPDLVEFYERYQGPNWLRNDNWLDAEVPICDWYGFDCDVDGQFNALKLPDNALSGEVSSDPTAIIDVLDLSGGIDFSGNRLTGEIETLSPWASYRIDLSDNELAGSLPEITAREESPSEEPYWLQLKLGGNQFSGAPPASWQNLAEARYLRLDLSDNDLSGDGDDYFMLFSQADYAGELDLGGNALQGQVPESALLADLVSSESMVYSGGLRLCGNELVNDDPEIEQWLQAHHVAGDMQACQNRSRVAIDTTVSGSWFDPARSGEGLTLHLLPSGDPLLYWFGYDLEGRQQWLFNTGRARSASLHLPELLETRGEFGSGMDPDREDMPRATAAFRLDRVEDQGLEVERVYLTSHEPTACPFVFERPAGIDCPQPQENLGDRLNFVQLTRLAGSRCDNAQAMQWVSGAWFDSEREGEGFVVEALENGQGLVYWFTYQPDDSRAQAWMIGLGEFSDNTLVVDSMLMPVGGVYGPDFDPDSVERVHWGSLTMHFVDSISAEVSWNSVIDQYGTGQHPVQRLSFAQLANCEG